MDMVSLTNYVIAAYLFAFAVRLMSLRANRSDGVQGIPRWACAPLALMATGLHGFAWFQASDFGANLNFSLLHAMSLVMLITNLLIITFPLTAIILLLGEAFPEPLRPLHHSSPGMTIHVLSSLIAFSFLGIASIQGILLLIQDACLRRRYLKAWILRSLPSLESMESLMFSLIGSGLLFLTLSLASGFVFLENMFAQHLVHKTVLALIAWLVFGTLVFGRVRFGWRGIVAIRWTLAGFAALFLAYLGSKLVIEMILKRA
jgi:ABC-type uncharacterized transport system permease subunit